MHPVDLPALLAEHARGGRPYREFLRVPALSAGLYVLPAGGLDAQSPHAEDEVYYVLSGRGSVRVGEEDHAVGPGALVHVPARVPHHFHSITEDLHLLVLFAPAESSP
jgi:mannose-6-phosphate isomerase-like protein (cupin superfamily)